MRVIKISIMKQKLYNLNMEDNISSLKKVEQEYYAKCVRKKYKSLKK